MNSALLDQIVQAVLYEGYILYPYRPSSSKNRRERFTFGRVYPESYSLSQDGAEPSVMQTECLVATESDEATLSVSVRFLHPMAREIGIREEPPSNAHAMEPRIRIVPELRVGNELYQTWHEAVERGVEAGIVELTESSSIRRTDFQFPSKHELESILDGPEMVGVIIRRQAEIQGTVEITAKAIGPRLFQITVRVLNRTAMPENEPTEREAVLLRTFASTHTVLQVRGGSFVSLMNPPEEYRRAADNCRNLGTWPVLVGDEAQSERDTMLSSPIILYDYPRIARESTGPLFDGTEIDEILTLRILTMTDAEKAEMRNVDEQARRLLERTESMPEDSLLKMHGTMRPGDPLEGSIQADPLSEKLTKKDEPGSLAFPTRPNPQLSSSVPGSPSHAQNLSSAAFDDFFGSRAAIESVSVGGVQVRGGDRVRIHPKGRADLLDMALNGRTAIVEAIEQDAERRIHLALVLEDDPGKDLGMLRQPGHRFFYGIEEIEPLPGKTT